MSASGKTLEQWEFRHTPASRQPGPTEWRRVRTPHAAFAELADVRAGGRVEYRTRVTVEAAHGDEVLHFDGVAPSCRVSVNGAQVAEHDGSWDAFDVPIGEMLRPGANDIEVQVDLPDFDPDSPLHFRTLLQGFVPDTMGPFAGVWRPVRLGRRSPLASATVDAAAAADALIVRWEPADGEVEVETAGGAGANSTTTCDARVGQVVVHLPGAPHWSPTHPAVISVTLRYTSEDGASRVRTIRTGLRTVARDGSWIAIDGERTFLRGVLHWGHYPEYGLPSPTADDARRELQHLVELGFNALKFCLWLPPQHYLDLCDELGILVWQELPLWLPPAGEDVRARIETQYPQLAEQVAGHPSVVLVSLGCELDDAVPTAVLDSAYDLVRRRLPDTVICANSGSGECFGGGVGAASDIDDYHFYSDVQNLEELFDQFLVRRTELRPWLFGEYNDADTWRDANEFAGPPAPAWLSPDFAVNSVRCVHDGFGSDQQVYRQREIIEANGYADETEGLTELSRAQAQATRRLVLELTRRREDITGYMITTLRDIPSSSSGLFDDANRLKFDSADFRQANDATVLSLASPLGRRWQDGGDRLLVRDVHNASAGEQYEAAIVLADGAGLSGAAVLTSTLIVGGSVVWRSSEPLELTPYAARDIATVRVPVPDLGADSSAAATFAAEVARPNGERVAAGTWPVLIHPRDTGEGLLGVHDPAGILEGWQRPGAIPVHDIAEIVDLAQEGAAAFVTTRYSDELRRVTAERGLQVFALDDGAYFPSVRAPFWRENVKRVHQDTWAADVLITEHLGEPGAAVATDRFVPRDAIRSRVGEHTPLITRYDVRSYSVGEYLFSWSEGAGRTVYSTLGHTGGRGIQPRSITENVLGRSLITAFVRDASRTTAQPSAAIE